MKTLKIIRDSDVGSALPEPEAFTQERKASRAVVFDDGNKVALVYSAKNNYHKLPGGGVDDGENLTEALERELMEEIGCKVENIQELGSVEEYRNEIGLHQTSFAHTAQVTEKGIAQLQPNEVQEEYVTKWFDLDEAIATLKSEQSTDHYHGKFMILRDITILEEAKNILNN